MNQTVIVTQEAVDIERKKLSAKFISVHLVDLSKSPPEEKVIEPNLENDANNRSLLQKKYGADPKYWTRYHNEIV